MFLPQPLAPGHTVCIAFFWMAAPLPEFAVIEGALPANRAEKEAWVQNIPLFLWDRNAEKSALVIFFGNFRESLCVTTRTSQRTYEIWESFGCTVIFRTEPLPTVVVLARLSAEGQEVTCGFSLISGRPLADATFALRPADPLLMGHLTMVAYRAALDARLVGSLYQDVCVLVDGFNQQIPDGVALWQRGQGAQQEPLERSLHRLQTYTCEALMQLDTHRLPEFVGPNLAYLQQLPPASRFPAWYIYHGLVGR